VDYGRIMAEQIVKARVVGRKVTRRYTDITFWSESSKHFTQRIASKDAVKFEDGQEYSVSWTPVESSEESAAEATEPVATEKSVSEAESGGEAESASEAESEAESKSVKRRKKASSKSSDE
jgi:hypothetical protein